MYIKLCFIMLSYRLRVDKFFSSYTSISKYIKFSLKVLKTLRDILTLKRTEHQTIIRRSKLLYVQEVVPLFV